MLAEATENKDLAQKAETILREGRELDTHNQPNAKHLQRAMRLLEALKA